MYETFGAREIDDTGKVNFRLFVPDAALDPAQYTRGKLPTLVSVHAVGDFQAALGGQNWKAQSKFQLTKAQFADPADNKSKGWLYELTTPPLPDGFYQYKFLVTYQSGPPPRLICDPCTRYGGEEFQNSGFVIGGPKMTTAPLANPLPYEQLIIYELMIDDFTAEFRGKRAPLAAVLDKLDYLQSLGVNAIEFMPWTQWPGNSYNWGYEPQDYFAVAHPYTLNPKDPTEKLFLLKRLISACHERGMHVIFDGVFDHVTSQDPGQGFGYRWLWENPDDSPYCGVFAQAAFGQDLDYHNGCVLDFITDVCRYWIETFCIDGIRFDYTLGFYDPSHPELGLPALLARLRQYLQDSGRQNFPLILEHEWDYTSVDVVNKVGATSCWLDPFRGRSREYLTARQIQSGVMRFLNSARDFGPGRAATTYLENHDHESFALNAGSREEWWRTQPYAIALLTAAGAPMLHNGQEFAELYPMPEDDRGVPADCQDPARKRVVPRPLRWARLNDAAGQPTFNLYQRLVDLRRKNPGLVSPNFHPSAWDESQTQPDAFGFGINQAQQTVVYHRWGLAADGRLEKFYIVLNFSTWPQTVSLSFPENDGWVDLLSGWQPVVQNNRLTLEVGSNWGHVLYKKY
ncbi:MAG TPA: alpha-amylase family glycosyl hydrolase [Verrucomicrobiae bacterium]